ncbi:adenosylcobinamide-phosphate synthase CbiB [Paraburkholderia caballeronis]|uniref:Cobalamin biosynthesis protein CobD n=1 Tax=Paraburkholderia caballeronis TaxID=416943 RepID=A0A1H7R8U1_9BURK|nr:adenosylcobinamide-phosphate synthase CbiB [Paraburkholderia caballeronis]PXW23592.1 adenosylcobinamide-phosphate synthase [Paraburkholderia caballeronis]PXW98933.1 adenosylcobinamide-phosphate synthase [Paraburkholderia caballeronis]RAJ96139.1 adenosylcobinamide-phosphate synthase [Paraburkholderia caballeronis]TDV14498.1 adenosylcobinamide-phosphate synthase [Paraburkholderia caballeronis]TDV16024.1 adenosylcobinamide-phosphate synthase [Paraburkholderia caballeronis]
MLSLPVTAALAVAAVFVDRVVGEPRRAHPLVAFGALANRLEARLNIGRRGRPLGLAAWLAAVAPPVAVAAWLTATLPWPLAAALHVALLWFALGARSLREHLAPIARALAQRDLAAARKLTSRIVSRDTSNADETALSRAAVESALENGNDAIFGALFWFAVAGGPGALAFRLANTLDAMWGYRTPRYLRFGWAAARIDDVLNWIPARLTAASYALLGDTRVALRCWRDQAPRWDSPNAGPVMAAGAGSLNVLVGGPAVYHGTLEQRPVLGAGAPPRAAHIDAALQLVERTTLLWLGALLALAFIGVATHV